MTVESASFINGLNASYPAANDAKSEGDDHIRLLKTTIKATFPNVTGAVSPTHTELNYVDGVTSAIQDQLDLKAPLANPTFTGTPAAPTAALGTNTTQVATTAYVVQGFAPLASPALTGNPTAPTQTAADNSTKIATAADVDAAAFAAVGPFQLTARVVSDDVNAANGDLIYMTAAGKTVTLPASPGVGNIIAVYAAADILNTVVDANGKTIQGDTSITIDVDQVAFEFTYISDTYGWVVS